jgi:hypothetical protein
MFQKKVNFSFIGAYRDTYNFNFNEWLLLIK